MSGRSLLIQVVAQLKPGRCGVSDYALRLAGELSTGFGIAAAFAVVNSTDSYQTEYPRIFGAASDLPAMCEAVSHGVSGGILVHLSGYGYSKDGAPKELAAALAKIKRGGRYPIAVCFHELFASAMPWRKAFWHSRRQRLVLGEIARLGDVLVTNNLEQAAWLDNVPAKSTSEPIRVLPVFSNAGEARTLTPFIDRRPVMVVFGLPSTRQRAYRELHSLATAIERLGIEEIVDIGPKLCAPRSVGGIAVRELGVLPASEVDSLLSEARFGFVAYPAKHLGKSGVFASFCAHGVVTILADAFSGQFDGVRHAEQLVSLRRAILMRPAELQHCSEAAARWHAGHCARIHAEHYSRWLAGSQETATV